MSTTHLLYGLCLQSVEHSLACGSFWECVGVSFTRPSPGVSIASTKCWGEKVWAQG